MVITSEIPRHSGRLQQPSSSSSSSSFNGPVTAIIMSTEMTAQWWEWWWKSWRWCSRQCRSSSTTTIHKQQLHIFRNCWRQQSDKCLKIQMTTSKHPVTAVKLLQPKNVAWRNIHSCLYVCPVRTFNFWKSWPVSILVCS